MIHSVPQQPLGIRQRVPIIGQQQQPTQQQQEQMAKMQIMQAVNEMAAGMYVQLAAANISGSNPELSQEVYEMQLRSLARKCLTAAKLYFEGIGVVEVEAKQE